MKKKILAVVMTVAMLFCAGNAFAFMDLIEDNSVNPTAVAGVVNSGNSGDNTAFGGIGIGGRGGQGGRGGNANASGGDAFALGGSGGKGYGYGGDQKQGQIGINDQKQGQIGINRQLGVVDQGNEQDTTIDASNKTDVFAPVFVAPSLNPVKGMNEAQINSILGGIGFSQTEEYSTCAESIKLTIDALKNGLITVEEAKDEYLIAKAQFEDATAPKRILSIGPKTRGRHLFNLFGIIATDPCDYNVDNNLGIGK